MEMDIKDIPFLPETRREGEDGSVVYDVPDGIAVLAATPIKGVRWDKVESIAVKEGCALKRVTTTRGFSVVCSENESLLAFNPKGSLRRIKPEEAVLYTKDKNGKEVVEFAHAVPISRRIPDINPLREHGFELGWLIGSFVSDGTINRKRLSFTKVNDDVRATFLKYISVAAGVPGVEKYARTYREFHNAAENSGIGGPSVKVCVSTSRVPKMLADLFSSCYDPELRAKYAAEGVKRTCLAKRLPPNFTTFGNDVLLGILSGLLDGDGTLSINKHKTTKYNPEWRGKPQVVCSINTSAPRLRDDIILMSKLLGMSLTYSTMKTDIQRNRHHDSFTISLSTEWLWNNLRKIKTVMYHDVIDYLRQNMPACAISNVTPMSYYALEKLEQAYPEVKKIPSVNAWRAIKCRAKKHGYGLFKRDTTRRYAGLIMRYVDDYYRDKALYSVVKAAFDEDVTWTRYSAVEDVPPGVAYGIGTRRAKVFSLVSGIVVPDTATVAK